MTTTQETSSPPEANGNGPENALAQAIAYEQAIADEAQEIRNKLLSAKDSPATTTQLVSKLWPLLRKPIPSGFIVSTPATKGKPYDSTGIKSLQVQIDRMDNVLTPMLWGWKVEYEQDGKLAHVTVWVGDDRMKPLFVREARGGVDRANTIGNLFKGTETNAAKLAFARVGPGHEVYLGVTDFDPDTDEDAAKAQEASSPPPVATIDGEAVAELVGAYEALKANVENPDKLARDVKVMLGSIGVPTPSLNKAFGSLTPAQRDDVSGWLASYGSGR